MAKVRRMDDNGQQGRRRWKSSSRLLWKKSEGLSRKKSKTIKIRRLRKQRSHIRKSGSARRKREEKHKTARRKLQGRRKSFLWKKSRKKFSKERGKRVDKFRTII